MSITREEAIKELERLLSHWDDLENGKRSFRWYSKDAVGLALSALRPVSREQLSEFKTCELVDELRKREGVETHIAEPYQDVEASVNGPAVVLVVID